MKEIAFSVSVLLLAIYIAFYIIAQFTISDIDSRTKRIEKELQELKKEVTKGEVSRKGF